ncbi:MAG: cytidylate kinase-like family protein [bacterium]|nr:cytidylate kinase-like family protein [bacterium]
MAIITVSREYGSDGRTVAQKVAEALGYEHIDKDLLVEVARKVQVPVAEVARYDEQPEHSALRILRKFLTPGYADTLTGLSEYEWWATATVPELSSQDDQAFSTLDEEVYVRLTREVLTEMVEQGDLVTLGRGSQAMFSERSDALHIRIVAPKVFKVQITMGRDDLDGEEAALKRMKEVDEKRRLYIKRHYHIDWADPRNYHLTVNTGLMGVDGAVAAIVGAARRLPVVQPMIQN